MNDMVCPHCGKMITPKEGDEVPTGFYDYVHFYCPECGEEI